MISPIHANSLTSSLTCFRNSGMAAPSSILRLESFCRSRSFLELDLLAKSFKTFQHSSGSVMLAICQVSDSVPARVSNNVRPR
ncbi:hypothetical protein MPTK1_8g14080 [Marchantia polymorpha subsp. ruderalis]|uniref:Uncharacterized protein n=1 Tax=Marchantia polymorpha TaxID=3197 RepID=A0A2R6WCW0_MARPO|nr:hypothetical protein MARPO_0108s0033 [Marchantia polymorpha]BBN19837.1 hypothetical protein Mp_8g14080 [Marchantia polymorpha subsp. ruderalis]|eukprot:PTQ31686.1 hypothetical protein MARPO_0108s0033 [Marchantia polymorpha]